MAEFQNATIMMGAVDETDSLRETVLEVLRLCDHRDLREIIIGYSQHITPDCKAVVDEIAAMESDVPVVTFMQHKKGIAALTEMIDIARGSHCILLASDMAMDLRCVADMIEGAKRDGDTIYSASRWLKGCTFYEYNRLKRVLNFAAQQFLKLLFHAKITDFTNPYQIVPTEVYQSIKWESMGFPILIEMVLKPLRLGYRFVEVPTNCYSRKQGKSNNSFKQTALYLKTALHVRFMKKQDMLKRNSVLYKRYES